MNKLKRWWNRYMNWCDREYEKGGIHATNMIFISVMGIFALLLGGIGLVFLVIALLGPIFHAIFASNVADVAEAVCISFPVLYLMTYLMVKGR